MIYSNREKHLTEVIPPGLPFALCDPPKMRVIASLDYLPRSSHPRTRNACKIAAYEKTHNTRRSLSMALALERFKLEGGLFFPIKFDL